MTAGPAPVILVLALLVGVALAEDEPAAPVAPIELHVRAFLKESLASRGSVQDKIFSVKLLVGRRLQMIPIKPLQAEQPFTLDPSTVRLGGGRFVAWYIPQPVSAIGGAASIKSAKAEALKLGTTIPRLARECVLKPDGTLHWKLPRIIPGATTASGATEAYVLLLDRKRIKRPVQPRPVRRAKGQSAAAYNAQRQAVAAAYRQQVQTFVATTKLVSSLPKEFAQPAPALIWAVFDVSSYQKVFSLSGATPALNWQVPYADLNRWRALCTGRGKAESLRAVLQPLLAQDHPLSRRAAVTIITSGTNLASVGTDPELLSAIGKLMTEADEDSQKTLAGAVSAGAGTTPAATQLLVDQMGHADPAVAQRAMAGLITSFKASEPDAEVVERLTGATNRLLALDNGPDLGRVLLSAVELSAAHRGLTGSLAQQIDLLKVSPKRRQEMIAAVCDHASDQRPLAEAWLNGQLLAAVDSKVRRAVLTELQHPAKRSGPSSQSLTALRQRFKLRDAQHRLLALLQSEDTRERELAWRSLPRFRVDPPDTRDKDPKQPAIFQAITDAAEPLSPAPIEAVRFLRAQAPSAFRTDALARLAGRSRGPAALEAIAVLAGDGAGSLARSLAGLDPTERENAARAWYLSPRPISTESSQSSAILGLVRLAGRNRATATKLTEWFAGQVVQQRWPHPRAWAAAVGDESALIGGLFHADREFARACAAGLVAQVAGPTKERVDQVMREAGEVAAKTPDGPRRVELMLPVWSETRTALGQGALEATRGAYALIVSVQEAPQEGGGTVTYGEAIELAQFKVAVDGEGVTLDPNSLVVQHQVAPQLLKLNDVAQLQALAAGKIEPAIAWPQGPIDFLPDRGESWTASVDLANGRRVWIALVPKAKPAAG